MKRTPLVATLSLLTTIALVALARASAPAATPAPAPSSKPALYRAYDEHADAKADIAAALESAKASGKKVLVVFGANWCGDCKLLDSEFREGRLRGIAKDDLVVVKVDVGRMNKNLDVAMRYDPNILKRGIPSIALLDATGALKHRTTGGEIADARKLGADGLSKFFGSLLGKAL